MEKRKGQSDQFINWSAQTYEGIDGQAPPATAETAHSAGSSRPPGAAWVAHRAVQAVWQARLQVCPGARAWPQVLSVREPGRGATADGVCAAGRGRAGSAEAGESPGVSGGPGGALRHKPGTAEAAGRAVVKKDDGPQQRGSRGWYRCGRGGHPRGQHAGRSTERRPLASRAAGGNKRCRRR